MKSDVDAGHGPEVPEITVAGTEFDGPESMGVQVVRGQRDLKLVIVLLTESDRASRSGEHERDLERPTRLNPARLHGTDGSTAELKQRQRVIVVVDGMADTGGVAPLR